MKARYEDIILKLEEALKKRWNAELGLEALDELADAPDLRQGVPGKLQELLYNCCIKTCRFISPTPNVVPLDAKKNFDRFLSAFEKVETSSENLAKFQLYRIRSKIYEQIDRADLTTLRESVLQEAAKSILQIERPRSPTGITEFDSEKHRINAVVLGAEHNTLITTLKYEIPFLLHRQPIFLDCTWKSLPVRVTIEPTPLPQGHRMFEAGGGYSMQGLGPSRWQQGKSGITLHLNGFLDCQAFSPALQGTFHHAIPLEGWPACFAVASEITKLIAWELRLNHSGEQLWIPAPSDIGTMEYTVSSHCMDQIEWAKLGSPAEIVRIYSGSSASAKEIKLGELSHPCWSTRCRNYAVMYFETGQLEECVFWLNVGIEALVDERISAFGSEMGKEDLDKEIASPKAFWSSAETIVAEQFPEMAGKVSWPEAKIHVSIFGKLNYLFKTLPMSPSKKGFFKKFNDINRHRNSLFHGHASNLKVAEVHSALESFDWIVESFKMRSNGELNATDG